MATYLKDDRETGQNIGYVATDWDSVPRFCSYVEFLADWDVKTICRDGEAIGAAFFRGDELHVSILPAWRKRWATKGILRELFDRDRVETRVSQSGQFMIGILERLGFVERDGGTYVLESKKWA